MNNQNYKGKYIDPITFEESEIETKISVNLVNEIKQALDGMEDYLNTPTLINPEDNSVVFGIMDLNNRSLKYKLIITPNY